MRTQRSWRASRAAIIALAAGIAACDVPSSPPIFEQTWVVPADSVEVNVSQILPTNVALNGGGTAFLVTVASPAAFATTLGTLCGQPECQAGAPVSAPVPAFTSSGAALTRVVPFPATVASATITGGTLALQVTNSLGFDPLRPNGASAPYGSLAITITNGATNTTTTFTGATQAMATGAVTNLSVPIPAGTYGTSFTVSAAFTVPAGNTATMAASNAFSIAPSVTGLTLSAASVVVNGEAISTTPTAFDLSDVDFGDEIESGAIKLDVVNPFTATATLQLFISAPAQGSSGPVDVVKNINIPATPTSQATVNLTKQEITSLAGKSGVTIRVVGTANGTGAGNTVSVTPAQVLKMLTSVQLVVRVGG